MIVALERRGLISRVPRQPRTIKLLVSAEELQGTINGGLRKRRYAIRPPLRHSADLAPRNTVRTSSSQKYDFSLWNSYSPYFLFFLHK